MSTPPAPTPATSSNDEQRAYWNGPAGERWASARAKLDHHLAGLSDGLFAFAAPRAGERAVDLGCGAGTTTLELHRRTGAPTVGLDLSAPLIALARQQHRPDLAVTFDVADVQEHPFTPRYDLAFSRFGVMFFADPVRAFTNIRRGLVAGGRLTFACWRELPANPWAAAPLAAARPLLPATPPPDPHAPGPFALADAARHAAILTAAGFTDITSTPLEAPMDLGATVDEAAEEALEMGPLARLAAGLDEPTRAAIRARVRDAYAPFAGARVTPPAAIWLVTGRA